MLNALRAIKCENMLPLNRFRCLAKEVVHKLFQQKICSHSSLGTIQTFKQLMETGYFWLGQRWSISLPNQCLIKAINREEITINFNFRKTRYILPSKKIIDIVIQAMPYKTVLNSIDNFYTFIHQNSVHTPKTVHTSEL